VQRQCRLQASVQHYRSNAVTSGRQLVLLLARDLREFHLPLRTLTVPQLRRGLLLLPLVRCSLQQASREEAATQYELHAPAPQ